MVIEVLYFEGCPNREPAVDLAREVVAALALSAENGLTRLAIRDTGPGVPEEAVGSLFTPFFSTKKNGRGLGLTIVQEILSNHGFDFGLDGRTGGGAEFWIRF